MFKLIIIIAWSLDFAVDLEGLRGEYLQDDHFNHNSERIQKAFVCVNKAPRAKGPMLTASWISSNYLEEGGEGIYGYGVLYEKDGGILQIFNRKGKPFQWFGNVNGGQIIWRANYEEKDKPLNQQIVPNKHSIAIGTWTKRKCVVDAAKIPPQMTNWLRTSPNLIIARVEQKANIVFSAPRQPLVGEKARRTRTKVPREEMEITYERHNMPLQSTPNRKIYKTIKRFVLQNFHRFRRRKKAKSVPDVSPSKVAELILKKRRDRRNLRAFIGMLQIIGWFTSQFPQSWLLTAPTVLEFVDVTSFLKLSLIIGLIQQCCSLDVNFVWSHVLILLAMNNLGSFLIMNFIYPIGTLVNFLKLPDKDAEDRQTHLNVSHFMNGTLDMDTPPKNIKLFQGTDAQIDYWREEVRKILDAIDELEQSHRE